MNGYHKNLLDVGAVGAGRARCPSSDENSNQIKIIFLSIYCIS
jgi:hypothetical protein